MAAERFAVYISDGRRRRYLGDEDKYGSLSDAFLYAMEDALDIPIVDGECVAIVVPTDNPARRLRVTRTFTKDEWQRLCSEKEQSR